MEEVYITVSDLAKRWKIKKRAIYGMIQRGEITYYSFVKKYLFRLSDIEEFENRFKNISGGE